MSSKPLTNKQLEILILIYRYRFLNSNHIQKFLLHKNNTRTSQWLKDLTDKNILNRIYSKTLGEINKPAIYYLGNKSRQLLKEVDEVNPDLLNRVYREKHRSEGFRTHSMFIADLYFHFQKAAKKQNAICHFYTATDLSQVAYAPLPLPDGYMTIKDGKNTKRYFLDILDNRPMFMVRKRVEQYINYYEAEYWQDNYKYPFPKVLLICPTMRVLKSLKIFIESALEDEDIDLSFFLAQMEEIQKRGIKENTWES